MPSAKMPAKPSKAPRQLNQGGQLDAQISGQDRGQAREQGRAKAVDQERKRQLDAESKRGAESIYEPEQTPSAPASVRSFSLPNIPSGGAVQTGAGIVLGGIGYAVLKNWIQGGPAQAKAWVLAKLINKTA